MRWFLEAHAAQRMKEMNLTRGEIVDCIDHPETDYPSHSKKYGAGYRVATKGPLAVVYRRDEGVVITCLWNGKESRE